MTITELIAELEKIKSEHGNLPIYRSIWDGCNEEQVLDVLLREPHCYGYPYEDEVLPLRVVLE